MKQETRYADLTVKFTPTEKRTFQAACKEEGTTCSGQLRVLANRWSANRQNDKHRPMQKECPGYTHNMGTFSPRVNFNMRM